MTEHYGLNDTVRNLLIDLVRQRTGLDYSNGKADLLIDKITPLVLEHRLDTFLDYLYLLKYSEDAETEWRHLETALAVNETYFWREFDAIRTAVEVVIPQLREERPGQVVRIWHAGCATGEEPYSLAMALLENGCIPLHDVEILASDMNAAAVALARSAVYRQRSLRNLPAHILEKYFTSLHGNEYRLNDTVRAMVRFGRINLMDADDLHQVAPIDIIFCRNVFIYFNDEGIQKVTDSFYRLLKTPGYLFLGAPESLLRISTPLELSEINGSFCYLKAQGQPPRVTP